MGLNAYFMEVKPKKRSGGVLYASMKILWILVVWPEPDSSAAGVRTLQLIEACRAAGNEVFVISACQENAYRESLQAKGFPSFQFLPNDSKFDDFIRELNPDIVFFDRFMIEEQFSWRVRAQCPTAFRVLDTVDLHSLRRARQRSVDREEISNSTEHINLQSDDAFREVAAIFRSDLSLIVSPIEEHLLKTKYSVPDFLLGSCAFFYPPIEPTSDFSNRNHFVSIGNFNHQPNIDSFRLLKTSLWQKVQKALERRGVVGTELHIYGAYAPNEFLSNKAFAGIRYKGKAENAVRTLGEYRVNLAPLRFGAGIKGKVADGWAAGTPCVGTSIAAEGMHGNFEFGGIVEDNWDEFAEAAAELYCNQAAWEEAKIAGQYLLGELFGMDKLSSFIAILPERVSNLPDIRTRNIIGSILWYESNRCTEYFSRWIELKEKL